MALNTYTKICDGLVAFTRLAYSEHRGLRLRRAGSDSLPFSSVATIPPPRILPTTARVAAPG